MTTRSSLKTEHAGAKNGGGYFGRRAQAKAESQSKRRRDDEIAVAETSGEDKRAPDEGGAFETNAAN